LAALHGPLPGCRCSPNAGSPGGICRLLVIRAGNRQPRRGAARHILPESPPAPVAPTPAAHVMAGLQGGAGGLRLPTANIDLGRPGGPSPDTRRIAGAGDGHLSPTHGVFETGIPPTPARWCTGNGGQVYLDGAISMPGGARPAGQFGADACHLKPAQAFCNSRTAAVVPGSARS